MENEIPFEQGPSLPEKGALLDKSSHRLQRTRNWTIMSLEEGSFLVTR